MLDFWSGLVQADFLPHGWCYRWQPGLVSLHVASDILITLAYYFIPFALLNIVRRRGDLAYPWMFSLFGVFILACGTTHLMSVFVVWYPWYRLDGLIKLITALASVPTAFLLFRISPSVIALPSPTQLQVLNSKLADEIAVRTVAEEQVRSLNADLERRVAERTAELERVNAELRETEHRLRSILDSSPTLVYIKDPGGKFLFVNRHFEQSFEMPRDSIIGKTGFELFPETLATSYATSDHEVFNSEKPQEFEEMALQNGGMRIYMSIKFPLRDVSGKVYGLCGISSDITERKKAEEALRQYNQELEQFAQIAAHDLQEPLRTVKSYSQLLIRRYGSVLEGDGHEFLNFLASGVERMRLLISGLQSFSEVDRNQIAAEPVSASEVLAETLQNMSASIEESGAVITTDNLLPVRIGRVHLQQVFQNLISNAIKYSGENVPRIHISATKLNRTCEIVVTDNGIGMEMRYSEHIFRVFRRLHGHEIPGTGIGLAICKKVVEAYGGRIWVISEPGLGSEFHFTAPC